MQYWPGTNFDSTHHLIHLSSRSSFKAAPRPWPSTWFLPLCVLRFFRPRVDDASSRQRRCNNHRRSILLSVNRDTVWSFNERPWINGVRNCWKNLVQWYSSCNEISSFGKLGGHVWGLQLRESLTLGTTETIKMNSFVSFFVFVFKINIIRSCRKGEINLDFYWDQNSIMPNY